MSEIASLKERILQYLDNKGISKYECYQKTGITNGVFSKKEGLSEDNLLRFISYYTDVNPDWLLTGEGSMLRSGAAQEHDPAGQCAGGVEHVLRKELEQLKEELAIKNRLLSTLAGQLEVNRQIIEGLLKKSQIAPDARDVVRVREAKG